MAKRRVVGVRRGRVGVEEAGEERHAMGGGVSLVGVGSARVPVPRKGRLGERPHRRGGVLALGRIAKVRLQPLRERRAESLTVRVEPSGPFTEHQVADHRKRRREERLVHIHAAVGCDGDRGTYGGHERLGFGNDEWQQRVDVPRLKRRLKPGPLPPPGVRVVLPDEPAAHQHRSVGKGRFLDVVTEQCVSIVWVVDLHAWVGGWGRRCLRVYGPIVDRRVHVRRPRRGRRVSLRDVLCVQEMAVADERLGLAGVTRSLGGVGRRWEAVERAVSGVEGRVGGGWHWLVRDSRVYQYIPLYILCLKIGRIIMNCIIPQFLYHCASTYNPLKRLLETGL